VAATRAGDDHAFEQLYRRYQRRIAAYVLGMVHDHGRAEDITQEVFMSALRRMRETERPIVFKPWVYEIAKNACIDAFRRSKRAEEISYDAEEGLGSSDYGRLVSRTPAPDAAVDTRQSLDHLRGAFGGLSETHHDILVMRELEGLSYREIGRRLGMSRPSVESTLFRARRRLSEEYEELTSGERCRRVQALIADGGARRLGIRDERKLGRHVSHCQPCRRAAYAAGFDVAALQSKTSLGAKVAALLPFPAFVKRWFGGAGAGDGGPAGRLAASASQYAEPASGWIKAAAVAVTVAVAGAGAGVATSHGDPKAPVRPAAASPTPAAAAAAADKQAAGRTTTTTSARRTGARTTTAGRATRSAGRRTAAARSAARSGGRSSSGGSAAGSPAAGGSSGAKASGVKASGTGAASNAGSSASGAVGSTVDKTAAAAGKTVTGTANAVGSTVNQTAGAVDKTVGAATGAVDNTVSTATGAVDNATNGATAPVTGAVNGATGAATGAVNGAASTATGAVQGATGTVTGAASNPAGTVTGAASDPAGTVGGLLGHG
jgi:RNA polymerase sigma factor (sigma-70 family)